VIVWRICKAARAATAFDGEGARLYPGRWNSKGVAVVYCASSLALAALEYFVHLDADEWPDDLVAIRAEVPDEVLTGAEVVAVRSLPSDWRAVPTPVAVQNVGSAWVSSARTVALFVPSVVIPVERNVLLNPAHVDMRRVTIDAATPFEFDPRMKRN
jgi:RES domain-containing protein